MSWEPSDNWTEPREHGTSRKGLWTALGVVLVLALVVIGLHLSASSSSRQPSSALASTGHATKGSAARFAQGSSPKRGSSRAVLPLGPMAPNGSFVTIGGETKEVSSYRGKPVMLWFVVGGCASCAVSIPAVSRILPKLRQDGMEVITLGLWGDFPPGTKGLSNLAQFGTYALEGYAGQKAGSSIRRPGWTWGMASKSLSLAYDPSGTPDVYALIGPQGHIRYRNSVPASTTAQLLKAASELHAEDLASGSTTAKAASGNSNSVHRVSLSRSVSHEARGPKETVEYVGGHWVPFTSAKPLSSSQWAVVDAYANFSSAALAVYADHSVYPLATVISPQSKVTKMFQKFLAEGKDPESLYTKATVESVDISGCRARLTLELYYPNRAPLRYISSWVRPFDKALLQPAGSSKKAPSSASGPSDKAPQSASLKPALVESKGEVSQYGPWLFVGDNRVGGYQAPCGV